MYLRPESRLPGLFTSLVILATVTLCLMALGNFLWPGESPTAFMPVGYAATAPRTFTVDQYFVLGLEYDSPTDVIGANSFGPASKAELCAQASAALVSQAHQFEPHGHVSIATCLRVKFTGPARLVVDPHPGMIAMAYMPVAMEYSPSGEVIGSSPRHASASGRPSLYKTAAQCHAVAQHDIDTGHIAPGVSVLIYCIGVPMLPGAAPVPGSGTV